MVSLTGQSIGRYHILEQLGEGGMATVYKAYDTRLERNVAFKVLRTDLFGQTVLAQVLQRFEREAKSLAKLKHPNIVNILDYGEHEGMPYLVMEYLPGGTLKQKLGQALFWGNAIQLLLPVARGLSYAHQHGVIHRDVKPANILIDQNEEPILTDFGIAKLLEGTDGHTLTGSGVGIGTPEYMAPEQGIGARAIDARADIYSLGIVLYEMVTGRKPYIADTPMAVVLKQMTDPLPHPAEFVSELPESVEHILLKALAKDPNDRYPDMHALIAAMENALAETIAPARSPQVANLPAVEKPVPVVAIATQPVKEKTKPRAKLSPKMIVAVVGALVVIMLIIFGAPRIKQLFPAMPAAKATSTQTLTTQPIATVTAVPRSATPKPSPTLTNTPEPTITPTPVPAWVTDFAEPILAAIKDRAPDFQDDFSPNDPRGWPRGWFGGNKISVENGMMHLEGDFITNTNIRFKTNYVLQVDITRPIPTTCCVTTVINPGYSISLGSTEWGLCNSKSECNWENYSFGEVIEFTLIVRKAQAAIYFDGKPVSYLTDPSLADGFFTVPGINCWGISCDLDNFRFWNLNNISNLP